MMPDDDPPIIDAEFEGVEPNGAPPPRPPWAHPGHFHPPPLAPPDLDSLELGVKIVSGSTDLAAVNAEGAAAAMWGPGARLTVDRATRTHVRLRVGGVEVVVAGGDLHTALHALGYLVHFETAGM